MLPLFLSFALAAAPIPKGGPYEGSIALFLVKPEPSALILSPSGEELKRISIKDIEGEVEAIRIGRDQSCLLVETHYENPNLKNQFQQSLYLISLKEKSLPKRILTRDSRFSWLLNREGTTIYGSELDRKPKPDTKVHEPQTHWQFDVKSGKLEKIDLPDQYSFVDIAHADNSILVALSPIKNEPLGHKFLILNSKSWKSVYQSPDNMLASLISPDGKSVLCNHLATTGVGQKQFQKIVIFNAKANDSIEFPNSHEVVTALAYSFGTNNRVVSVVEGINRLNPNYGVREVYVQSYDGTSKKKIYN